MTRISSVSSSAPIIGVGIGYSNDPVTSILKKYKGRKMYHRQQGGGFLKKRPFKNRSTRRRTHKRRRRESNHIYHSRWPRKQQRSILISTYSLFRSRILPQPVTGTSKYHPKRRASLQFTFT